MNNKTIDEKQISMFLEELQKRKDELVNFWNSAICEEMIAQVVKVNRSFTSTDIMYEPEKTQAEFGWNMASGGDLLLFLQCLQDEAIGDELYDFDSLDVEPSFADVSMLKRGLRIDVIYGQGSFVNVSVFDDEPEGEEEEGESACEK